MRNKPVSDFHICKLCNGIVKNSSVKYCEECENLFCESCLLKRSKNLHDCPYCELDNANNSIKSEIPYSSYNQDSNSNKNAQNQNKPLIDYKMHKFMKSLIDEIILKCPLECTEEVRYGDLTEHFSLCRNISRLYICNLCKDEVFIQDNSQNYLIAMHNDSCPYVTVECRYCKQEVVKEFIDEHLRMCDAVFISCSICKLSFAQKFEKAHNEYYCKKIFDLKDILITFIFKLMSHYKLNFNTISETTSNKTENINREIITNETDKPESSQLNDKKVYI